MMDDLLRRLVWFVVATLCWWPAHFLIDRAKIASLTLETFYYVVNPLAAAVALALAPAPFDLRSELTVLQTAVLFSTFGFYTYGLLSPLLRRGKALPGSIVFHHGGFVLAGAVLALASPLLQSLSWIAIGQLNSAVHEIGRSKKNANRLTPKGWARWVRVELIVFIVARFVFVTPFAIVAFWDAAFREPPMVPFALVIFCAMVMLTVLHLKWLRATYKRMRRAEAASNETAARPQDVAAATL